MVLRAAITTTLLLNILISNCQDKTNILDSLNKILNTNPDSALHIIEKYDSLKTFNGETNTDAKYLIYKARAYKQDKKYTSALQLLTEALHIYNKLEKKDDIYKTLYRLAQLYSETGVDDKAKYYYNKSYDIAKNIDVKDAWDCLYYSARIDISNRDYDKALMNLDKAAKNLAGKDSSNLILAEVLNIKGIIYLRINDFESALSVLDSAKQINIDNDNKISLAINYTNIGRLYFNKKDYYTAHEYFSKAYSIDSAMNNTKGLFTKSLNLANTYIRLRKWEDAEKIYKKLLTVPDIKTDNKYMSRLHHNMAILYYDNDRQKETSEHLDKSIEYTKKLDDKNYLSDLYYLKSRNEFYYKKNRTEAYELLLKSFDIKNKLYLNDVAKTIKSYQLKTRIIEKDIEINNRSKELTDSVNKLTIQRNIVLVILLCVILLSLLVYYVMRKKIAVNISSFDRYKGLIKGQKERYLEMNDKFNSIVSENNSVKEMAEHTKNDLEKLIMLIEESGKITQECIKTAENISSKDTSKKLIEDLKRLNKIISGNDIIRYHLDNEYSEFRYKLNQRFSNLTKGEEQLCILIRYNYSISQIATYTNTSQKTVEVARYRLRKKLGFDNNNDFYDALSSL